MPKKVQSLPSRVVHLNIARSAMSPPLAWKSACGWNYYGGGFHASNLLQEKRSMNFCEWHVVFWWWMASHWASLGHFSSNHPRRFDFPAHPHQKLVEVWPKGQKRPCNARQFEGHQGKARMTQPQQLLWEKIVCGLGGGFQIWGVGILSKLYTQKNETINDLRQWTNSMPMLQVASSS